MPGLSAGVHLGFDVEILLGGTLALAPGSHLYAGPEYGKMRSGVALLAPV